MTGWVSLEGSTPISRHISSLCSEASDSTYMRDADIRTWATLPGKHFPFLCHWIICVVRIIFFFFHYCVPEWNKSWVRFTYECVWANVGWKYVEMFIASTFSDQVASPPYNWRIVFLVNAHTWTVVVYKRSFHADNVRDVTTEYDNRKKKTFSFTSTSSAGATGATAYNNKAYGISIVPPMPTRYLLNSEAPMLLRLHVFSCNMNCAVFVSVIKVNIWSALTGSTQQLNTEHANRTLNLNGGEVIFTMATHFLRHPSTTLSWRWLFGCDANIKT